MKEDKEEKIFSFEGFPLKDKLVSMTDEEFEQWAENHANAYNSFVKSYKAQDPNLFVSETGSLAFELMPLIFIKMVFCNEEIREITKEEVLEKYSYLRDANLLSELEEQIKRLSNELNKFDNIGE